MATPYRKGQVLHSVFAAAGTYCLVGIGVYERFFIWGCALNFIFHLLNHCISWCFPKSKRIWIYGEWFGDKFCDNSSYAFRAKLSEYGRKHGVKKIWVTRDRDIVSQIRRSGGLSYYAYSIKGLYYQARAKVFICSVNSKDFCFSSLTPRVVFFQLWHGLPIKKIGFDVAGKSRVKSALDYLRSLVFDRYSYVISPSSDFDKIFCSAFNLSPDNIIRAYSPRCDGLFCNEGHDFFYEKLDIKTKHVVFYLPTHRKEGRAPEKIRSLIRDMKSIDDVFKRIDVTLVVKPHYYEFDNFEAECFGNVRVVKDLPMDLYRCLSLSSAIITDYSSVSLDYCITGKPIFYYAPDLADYVESDRETYFDYNSLLVSFSEDSEGLSRELEDCFVSGVLPAKIKISLPQVDKNDSLSDVFQLMMERKVFGGVDDR